MKYKKEIMLSSFLLFSLFLACTELVGPTFLNPPFVSLTIGDERQFIDKADSSTVLYIVKEKIQRSDGLDVYIFEWYSGTDTNSWKSYYAIKDGFFIATELEIVSDSNYYLPTNPYREQRLAKLYPEDGEIWQSIPGDSTSSYFSAKSIGKQTTPAGTFDNSFSFTLDNLLSVNYSKGIGHISSIVLSDSSGILSTYIKVNGKIYGTKFPKKDPHSRDGSFKNKRKLFFNKLLGAR
jgi:hypothetical protein